MPLLRGLRDGIAREARGALREVLRGGLRRLLRDPVMVTELVYALRPHAAYFHPDPRDVGAVARRAALDVVHDLCDAADDLHAARYGACSCDAAQTTSDAAHYCKACNHYLRAEIGRIAPSVQTLRAAARRAAEGGS